MFDTKGYLILYEPLVLPTKKYPGYNIYIIPELMTVKRFSGGIFMESEQQVKSWTLSVKAEWPNFSGIYHPPVCAPFNTMSITKLYDFVALHSYGGFSEDSAEARLLNKVLDRLRAGKYQKVQKQMSKKKIVWFARGGGIAKAGPFDTQIDAVNSMRLTEETQEQYKKSLWSHTRDRLRGGFPDDVFVWPEEIDE